MTIDLYYVPGSAPCRSVQMTAKAVGVELNLKLTDLSAGEQLKPEFIKINPQHCVPTISDNGFNLWESNAINQYLVEKYGKDDSLYPRDVQKRALISQRLYFNSGTLFKAANECYRPLLFGGEIDDEKRKNLENAFGFLNTFLDGHTYVAGETLTLADIAIYTTASTVLVTEYDLQKHVNVARWYAHCEQVIPGKEVNDTGIEAVKELLAKAQAARVAAATSE